MVLKVWALTNGFPNDQTTQLEAAGLQAACTKLKNPYHYMLRNKAKKLSEKKSENHTLEFTKSESFWALSGQAKTHK